MGLTREEALKILGLTEDDSKTFAKHRYRKLATKYHPENNGGNSRALRKFKQIIAAYVRVRIEPDDCDQTKLKMILADLYDVNDDIVGNNRYRDMLEPDHWSDTDSVESVDNEYSNSSGGPYDAVLQDFMIRSYMPGKRSKPTIVPTTKKSYVTEEERAVAYRQGNELLKEEEEDKKKEEKRRERNKRKKEAKKRRKKGGSSGGGVPSSSCAATNSVHDSGDVLPAETMSDEEAEDEEEREETLDVNSAFVARLVGSSKVPSHSKSQSGYSSGDSSKSSPSSDKQSLRTPEPSHKQEFKNTTSVVERNRNDVVTSSSKYGKDDGSRGKKAAGGGGGGSKHVFSDIHHHQAAVYAYSVEESRRMAVLGNRAAKEGRFEDAILNFSEAIDMYPDDHRYYGNRSFCYDYTKNYQKALADAEKALFLQPEWPKGYFRKGRALVGLEQFDEAESFYLRAVELDPNYRDATEELRKLKLDQITNMGFDMRKAEEALAQYETVSSAVDALLAGKVKAKCLVSGSSNSSSSSSIGEGSKPSTQPAAPGWSHCVNLPPRLQHLANPYNQCRSVWVGNIDNSTITEEVLSKLFSRCGEVESVRLLPGRFCAFVNYTQPECSARAIKELQDTHLHGCDLLLRYPENPQASSSSHPSPPQGKARTTLDKKTGPVNGDECFFWRTTGCHFGERCRYRHVNKHKGIDIQFGNKKK